MRQFLSDLSLKCKLQRALCTTATSKKMATIPKENAEFSLDNAVKFYTQQVETGSPISYCACAARFGVNRETLCQQITGRQSWREANYNMSWFTAEDQVLINFFIEITESGFPDTKQYLRECINTLLRAKQGDPTCSVGVNWVDQWLECQKDHLQKYWNTSLNCHCANAVNPTTVADYFSKLQKVLTEHAIEPDCLWSMDETGLQFNHTPKKWVIGQAGKCQQHSIWHGTQEFATIILLISAAGVCPPPTVIFQGAQMNTTWTGEGNPLNAVWVPDSNLILCTDCMQALDVH